MDHIWSPWRYKYMANINSTTGCVFCQVLDGEDDKTFIIHRASHNFIILNIFPYTSGHLMIIPYIHQPSLTTLDELTTNQMMDLTKRALLALESEYHPDGFNIGINLGHCAGAGVVGHVHQHVVPRWGGDANFMSTVGETRVLPEELSDTYRRLKKHF